MGQERSAAASIERQKDSTIDLHFPQWKAETAAAFAEVGAAEIAIGLRAITAETMRDHPLLDRANDLITGRAGYDYETIRKVVQERLAKRSA